jgi:2-oxoglutarate ferredoxin oxidoreductase subunit alpha
MVKKSIKELEHVTIRFAGDSGDGMQLTGNQFTRTTALSMNDLSTFPDFPAEIRAPAGSVYGVSGFQIHFSSEEVHTPGDKADVLVAMNPAALQASLKFIENNAVIILNKDAFTPRNLKLAGYEEDPTENGKLKGYQVYSVDISRLTQEALMDIDLTHKEKERCKNFFALGIVYWLYNRKMDPTIDWIQKKFAAQPLWKEANEEALKAGRNFAEATELFRTSFKVTRAEIEPGIYRKVTGNEALVIGLIAAGEKSGRNIFLGSYPITPASEILQMMALHKNFGVKTFQAEDEMAAIGAAIGASFAGDIGVTATSGPGMALKSEFLGLAVMTELPLIICDIQRAGPSTGMPTKTEQSDLNQALYGRSGEAPLAVIAAKSPSDCFHAVYEAVKIATQFMTPVVVLSDVYLANGAEPWRIPDEGKLPPIEINFAKPDELFTPYLRDKNTLARKWAVPGTPNLEHRIGGLEKADITGEVSYDPDNHDEMVRLRAEKIQRIKDYVKEPKIYGDESGDILIVSWGSTYGTVLTVVDQLRKEGEKVSFCHLRWINPLPDNLGRYIKNFKKVIVPEVNLGQLAKIIRSEYLIEAVSFNKIRGLPLQVIELKNAVTKLIEDK